MDLSQLMVANRSAGGHTCAHVDTETSGDIPHPASGCPGGAKLGYRVTQVLPSYQGRLFNLSVLASQEFIPHRNAVSIATCQIESP